MYQSNPSAISAFPSFEVAVQSVLQFLHERIGFQLWMFTRLEGDDWIVLEACDHGYGVQTGDIFRWSDSFCSRMVRGLGPRIASQANLIPAYREAPIGQQVSIGAYIGIPLCHPDGSLFGTLCAIDPNPQSPTLKEEQALIELQTQLLTTILHYELLAQENARKYERAAAEAQKDALTGIYNRRGWDSLLVAEEARCQMFGQSVSIVVVDLDNLKEVNDGQGHQAGDTLIKSAAACLNESVRSCDVVARLGGDEFAILLLDIDEKATVQFVERIHQQLHHRGISASVGWAKHHYQQKITQTQAAADLAMYRQKEERKKARSLCKSPEYYL